MIIKIVYKDSKEAKIFLHDDVDVAEKKCEDFFRCISDQKFYYDPEKKCGFWTDISTIRYITVHKDDSEIHDEDG